MYLRKRLQSNNDIDKILDIPKEYWDAFDELIVKSIRDTFEVVYDGKFRKLVDKHFGDNKLCYLDNSEGIPVEKSKVKVTERGLLKFEWYYNNKKSFLEQDNFCV